MINKQIKLLYTGLIWAAVSLILQVIVLVLLWQYAPNSKLFWAIVLMTISSTLSKFADNVTESIINSKAKV